VTGIVSLILWRDGDGVAEICHPGAARSTMRARVAFWRCCLGSSRQGRQWRKLPVLVLIGVIGASLLYGDGVITGDFGALGDGGPKTGGGPV